ncbi:MAG: squalene/phytoene synthase family protein, partial [Alphaproteobacteria bacterium]|nr:squalene/phytoene synthase family protein [Alphaproteobacteria bacterium]
MVSYFELLKRFFAFGKKRKICRSYFDCILQAYNIADDTVLSVEKRLSELQKIKDVFVADNRANADFLNCYIELKSMFKHEKLVLSLFTDVSDALESRIQKKIFLIWSEFLDFNRKIATPSGRFLMALYDENPTTYLPMENLCTILKILDEIQQMKTGKDVSECFCLPQDLLQEFHVKKQDFKALNRTPKTQAVFTELAARLDAMREDSLILPSIIKNFRLRLRVFVMLSLTNFMIKRLQHENKNEFFV